MEKRAVLAIVISLVILVVYQQFFAPSLPEPAKEKPAETAQPAAPAKEGIQKGESIPSSSPSPTAAPALKAQPGKDVTVDTPLYTAVFDTRGARLKSWKVKKYLDKIGEGAKPLDLAKGELGKELPFGL